MTACAPVRCGMLLVAFQCENRAFFPEVEGISHHYISDGPEWTSYGASLVPAPTCNVLSMRSAASLIRGAACSIAYANVTGPGGRTDTASTPSVYTVW